MKKIITGAAILLAGAIIFMSTYIAASNLGMIGGWDERGRFLTAVSDNELMPTLVIGVIIQLCGLALLIWGNLDKSDNVRK